MRPGELLALRSGDVDWSAKRAHVRRSYVRGELGTRSRGAPAAAFRSPTGWPASFTVTGRRMAAARRPDAHAAGVDRSPRRSCTPTTRRAPTRRSGSSARSRLSPRIPEPEMREQRPHWVPCLLEDSEVPRKRCYRGDTSRHRRGRRSVRGPGVRACATTALDQARVQRRGPRLPRRFRPRSQTHTPRTRWAGLEMSAMSVVPRSGR